MQMGVLGGGLVAFVGFASAALGNAYWQLWVLFMFAPLTEEIVFRLGLHEAMLSCGMGRGASNLAVALIFAGVHVFLRGELHALLVVIPAIAIGVVYGRWRMLFPCVVLHALMNGSWFVFSASELWSHPLTFIQKK